MGKKGYNSKPKAGGNVEIDNSATKKVSFLFIIFMIMIMIMIFMIMLFFL
jgi:hypothetical protein